MRSGLVFWAGGRCGVAAGTFLPVVVVVLVELLAVFVGLGVHPGFGLRKEDPRLEFGPVFRSGFLRRVDVGALLRIVYFLELVAGCFHRRWDVDGVWASSSDEVYRLGACCLCPSLRGRRHRSRTLRCVDGEAFPRVMYFLELVAGCFHRR